MAEIYSIDGVIPVIDPSAFVHPSAVVIGDVVIGTNVYVAPLASLRGDLGRIVIGANSNIQDGVVIHGFPGTDTIVEEWGHVGHCAVIHGCHLQPNVLVGMNAVVLDGVVVGEGSFIGAAALIPANRKIPPRSLVMGVPASVVREVTDDELAWKRDLTQGYVDLALRSKETMLKCAPLLAPEANRPVFNLPPSIPLAEAKAALSKEKFNK